MKGPAAAIRMVVVALMLGWPYVCPGSEQHVPSFGSKVEVVAVPVFVTDKNGKAVPGLTENDFEVREQGKPVRLVAFQAIDAGAPEALLFASDAPQAALAAARRQFLFLFDLTFSTTSGVLNARKAAYDLVRDTLLPNDLAAVAVIRQPGVEVLVGFTSDRAQIAQAIAKLSLGAGRRLRDPLEIVWDLFGAEFPENPWGAYLEEEGGRGGGLDLDVVKRSVRDEGERYRREVADFMRGLEDLGRLLDSVRGRKQVILLSAGFNQSLLGGADGFEGNANRNAVVSGALWEVSSSSHFGDARTQRGMDDLFKVLAAGDTVVHTVNIAGLAAGTDVGSAVRTSDNRGADSLNALAVGTGGRAIRATNDLKGALREVLNASRYFYVLAFESPEAAKPGQVRKLSVRVKRPGLEVSHRTRYAIPDSGKPVAPNVRQAQAAEAIVKGLTGGAFGLSAVAVPYRNAAGRLSLPVVLEIDGGSLLSGASGNELKLEVYGYALDGEGRITDAVGVTPSLDLGKLALKLHDKGVAILTAFRVAPGPADLRFLVRDPATGRSASMRTTFHVPAFAPGEVSVSPPLLVGNPRSRVCVPVASRALPELEIPFRVADAAFVPEPKPVLANGVAREVCVMASGRAADAAPFQVTTLVVGLDGQEILLNTSMRTVADADGVERLVLRVTPAGIVPGDYTLRIRLLDPSTGVEITSHRSVEVQ